MAPETPDLLSATFPDLKPALLCARRIQWAVEGITEFDAFKAAAATIFVVCGDDPNTASGLSNWAGTSGLDPATTERRQILLSRLVCDTVEGLPGFALENARVEGFRSWSWRQPQPAVSFAADDQAILSMIHAAGRTDPVALSPPSTNSTPVPPAWANAAATPPAPSLGRTPAFVAEAEPAAPRKSSLVPILAAAAVVLLIAVAAVFFLNRKGPSQGAAPVQTAPAQSAEPAQSTAPGSSSTQVPHRAQADSHPKTKSPKEQNALVNPPKAEPATTPAPPPPAPVSYRCDITEEDIGRSLSRAENYMHSGDLARATAAFQHVLGCPSAHEKAQQGLIRIQKMAAENQ